MRPASRRSYSEAAKFRSWGRGSGMVPRRVRRSCHPRRGVGKERVPVCAAGPVQARPPQGKDAPSSLQSPGSFPLSAELRQGAPRARRLPPKSERSAVCPPGGAAEPGGAGGRPGALASARDAGWVLRPRHRASTLARVSERCPVALSR